MHGYAVRSTTSIQWRHCAAQCHDYARPAGQGCPDPKIRLRRRCWRGRQYRCTLHIHEMAWPAAGGGVCHRSRTSDHRQLLPECAMDLRRQRGIRQAASEVQPRVTVRPWSQRNDCLVASARRDLFPRGQPLWDHRRICQQLRSQQHLGLGPGLMPKELVDGLLVVVSILVTIQSFHALYLTLYTWDRPRTDARAPDTFSQPRLSFTVMLPARHEEAVIQATIGRVAQANYPAELIQVLVICSADDVGTIDKAEEKLDELRRESAVNASIVVFEDGPVNKPHGLNCGLTIAGADVVTVFDAEDDIHAEIFNVVN